MKVTEQNIQFLNLFHVSGWHTLVSLNSTYVILQVLVSFLRSAYLGASHLNFIWICSQATVSRSNLAE